MKRSDKQLDRMPPQKKKNGPTTSCDTFAVSTGDSFDFCLYTDDESLVQSLLIRIFFFFFLYRTKTVAEGCGGKRKVYYYCR